MMKEKCYLSYRILKAKLASVIFILCRVFPIDEKLISVCSFEGKKGFCCNPKYIVMEMHNRDKGYKFVWFVNDMNKEFPDYVQKVPNTLWSRAYWLSRSKIWIDNYRKPYGTIKRKGQIYINTWHGGLGFKPIGLMRGESFSKIAYLVSKNDSNMIDYVTIDSDFTEKAFPKGLVYDGPFLKYGCARSDALFLNDAQKNSLHEKYHLPKNAKLLLFAPTFREGSKHGKRNIFASEWTIDFRAVLEALENKFGGCWYVCLRVHPQLAEFYSAYMEPGLEHRFINESARDDIYEVLGEADAFISDYSGLAFEAALAGIPVFLYSDDLDEYIEKRGELIWDFQNTERKHAKLNKRLVPDMELTLPFSFANNNVELLDDITHFDGQEYATNILEFTNTIHLINDGHASERIVDELTREIL